MNNGRFLTGMVLLITGIGLYVRYNSQPVQAPTQYRLHFNCSSVSTTPQWGFWQDFFYSFTDDHTCGRFGKSLIASDCEYHENYRPIVAAGECSITFCNDCGSSRIEDSVTLMLPQEADTSSIHLLLSDHPDLQYIVWEPTSKETGRYRLNVSSQKNRSITIPFCKNGMNIRLDYKGGSWYMGVEEYLP